MEVNPVSLEKDDKATSTVASDDQRVEYNPSTAIALQQGNEEAQTFDEALGKNEGEANNVPSDADTAPLTHEEDQDDEEDDAASVGDAPTGELSNWKNSESDDEEDDEYDPEAAYNDDSPALVGVSATVESPSQSDDSDYDPEESVSVPVQKPSQAAQVQQKYKVTSSSPKLPPKPPVRAVKIGGTETVPTNPQNSLSLKDAMEAVMKSDMVKNPNFLKLPQPEQMKLIQEELSKHGVKLPPLANKKSDSTASSATSITDPLNPNNYKNYDQVYSYNKPFKHVKDRIPLIPVNEFCRRPNITLPMTTQERKDYDHFLTVEARYNSQSNWDEFPDKSRLFVGNLPANTITKQDLFRIFSKYGEVVQIVIKAGFGFVQFRTSESCLECIKGESNVPLHNKTMRLDASKPQKNVKGNDSPILSRGRERTADSGDEVYDFEVDGQLVEADGGDSKRQKLQSEAQETTQEEEVDESGSDDEESEPECYIYITSESQSSLVKRCNKIFSNSTILFEFEDVTDQDIQEVISDAAYTGIIGACIIKSANIDLQTFESTPDGGIKFDEYADIEPEIAIEILTKCKTKKADKKRAPSPAAIVEKKQSPAFPSSLPHSSLPAIPKKIKDDHHSSNNTHNTHNTYNNPNANNPNGFSHRDRGRNQRNKNQRIGQHAVPGVPNNSYGSYNYATGAPFNQSPAGTPPVTGANSIPAIPQNPQFQHQNGRNHNQNQPHSRPQQQHQNFGGPTYSPSPVQQQQLPQQAQPQASQQVTPQPGFGVPTYGAPPPPPPDHNPYGVPYGQHQQGGQQQPYPPVNQQQQQQPPINANNNNELLKTLQSMDPASMQNMIALLQQQQQQQAQALPPQAQSQSQNSPYGYQQQYAPSNYGGAPPNANVYSNPNASINYGSPNPPQTQTQPPKSQLDSLLSQLQTNSPSYLQGQGQPQGSQELMETLKRLSGQ